MKEKMRLKKEQRYPEIVKLDDGHEMVVVQDHEGRNLLMHINADKCANETIRVQTDTY
jgi:uncharacterized protein (DUF2249 family)